MTSLPPSVSPVGPGALDGTILAGLPAVCLRYNGPRPLPGPGKRPAAAEHHRSGCPARDDG